MNAVIRCRALSRSFGGKRVVDRLDLAVPQGAIWALLGDNGAGKSTTIRMLTGQLQADSGTAEVLGEDCWHAATRLRFRVGYCPEKPRYYDWMTISELGRFAAGLHRSGYRTRFTELTRKFGLGGSAKLRTLSKGGYAKVGLALALASDPEVLILDEPTSGLDLFTRREFLSSMVELAGDGKTILLSSHAISETERVASHVTFLAEGKVLLSGSLDDLRERLVRVRVRQAGVGIDPAGLGNVLDCETSGRDWQAVVMDPPPGRMDELRTWPGVASVEVAVPTLEEMYTALLARYHRPEGHKAAIPVLSAEGEEV